jgi:hypothetical protein
LDHNCCKDLAELSVKATLSCKCAYFVSLEQVGINYSHFRKEEKKPKLFRAVSSSGLELVLLVMSLW